MTMEKAKKIENAVKDLLKVWYVAASGNTKTGKMAVTYTTENSCPARCPFKKHGCYAENFPCCHQWKKAATKGIDPQYLKEVIEHNKKCEILRHNVAGDLARNHSNNIDAGLVKFLCNAYKSFKAAYTYTHCSIDNKDNIEIVKNAMQENFVINFSTENINDAKKGLAAGVNVVIACNSISDKVVTKKGIKIVQCPATYNKEKHCQNCGLCWQKNRPFVIAFPVHGNKKNVAKNSGFLTDL